MNISGVDLSKVDCWEGLAARGIILVGESGGTEKFISNANRETMDLTNHSRCMDPIVSS